MAVKTKVEGQVGVKTWAQAILHVAHEVFRIWLIVLDQRGLPNDALNEQKEILVNGLWTWLLSRHLKAVYLEIYQEQSNDTEERWDLVFSFANPNERVDSKEEVQEVWKTYLDEMSEVMAKLKALDAGVVYRIVVDLADKVEGRPPPKVKGWAPTELRRVDKLQKIDMGEEKPIIDAGPIKSRMIVWGKLATGGEHKEVG